MSLPQARAVDVFDVVYHILTLMSPVRVLKARRVSRLWADASRVALSARFHPSRVFRPFFRSVWAFRAIMACYNVIAAGSRVLSLFEPVDGPIVSDESGLDLFVERCDVPYLNAYLRSEGYIVVADSTCNPHVLRSTPYATMPNVVDFPYKSLFDLHRRFVLRVTRWSNGTRVIDVACTAWTPVMAVFYFATSADMNFMSWDGVFCLFPRATLIDGVAVVPGGRTLAASAPIRKGEARGFSVRIWHEISSATAAASLAPGCRWLGDGLSWSITHGDDGSSDARGDRLWHANGLQIRHIDSSGPRWPGQSAMVIIQLLVAPLEHRLLSRHTYAVPPFITSKYGTFARMYISQGEEYDLPSALPRLLAWYEGVDGDSDSESSFTDTGSSVTADSAE